VPSLCAVIVTEQAARSFSKGEPVDSIETERSRVVLHDLEQGWWILAVGKAHHLHEQD